MPHCGMAMQQVELKVESWFNCVRMLAGRIDVGRSQLVVDHPELGTSRPASLAVPLASVEKRKLLAILRRRVAEFPIGRSVRDGTVWSGLLAEYVAVKETILCVAAWLDSAVALLMHIENSLPVPRSGAVVARLSGVLRIYLQDAQRVLDGKTTRLLESADLVFGIDQRTVGSTTPSQPSDAGSQEGV